MESRRGDGTADLGLPRRRFTRELALGAAFSIPVALAALSEGVAVDLLIYLSICVEGIAVASIAMSGIRSPTDLVEAVVDTLHLDRKYLGTDRVEMMADSIRSAAKGAEISRREIARALSRILDEYKNVAPGVDHSEILGYLHGTASGADARLRPSKPLARGEYLAGLEGVVTSLERATRQCRGP